MVALYILKKYVLFKVLLTCFTIYIFIYKNIHLFLGVEDAPLSRKEESSHIAMASVGVPFVTGVIMKAVDASFRHALEGLNSSTIIDPQRHALFEAVYSLLPASDDIARVAAIRAGLKRQIGRAHV